MQIGKTRQKEGLQIDHIGRYVRQPSRYVCERARTKTTLFDPGANLTRAHLGDRRALSHPLRADHDHAVAVFGQVVEADPFLAPCFNVAVGGKLYRVVIGGGAR